MPGLRNLSLCLYGRSIENMWNILYALFKNCRHSNITFNRLVPISLAVKLIDWNATISGVPHLFWTKNCLPIDLVACWCTTRENCNKKSIFVFRMSSSQRNSIEYCFLPCKLCYVRWLRRHLHSWYGTLQPHPNIFKICIFVWLFVDIHSLSENLINIAIRTGMRSDILQTYFSTHSIKNMSCCYKASQSTNVTIQSPLYPQTSSCWICSRRFIVDLVWTAHEKRTAGGGQRPPVK